ncbi:phage major capsid protein, partial [Staphylococcus epidermidis]|nr:phage major capsid protein [Staphylococcus epidermidis]MCO6275802.1 phage major capsid protein [Staphylococcus epidermidis]
NLFEQELIALRVTMDVAFHIADDKAFAKLTAGSGSTGGNTETV